MGSLEAQYLLPDICMCVFCSAILIKPRDLHAQARQMLYTPALKKI